ncbi:hypothetical protein [Streptomyces sp. NBC_01320]|uniref:hypothetical protein n=1 Tax=Streptomyces sp. NBC_01320 TaxID=2903824 RepID=UPI002E11CBA6|nr:ATP-binding protein [Streptomyces sp. NBC_01320]
MRGDLRQRRTCGASDRSRPYGSARTAYEDRDDPPVVVLTGGRGMGKTAVLKQLRHLYREITPVALADCEAVTPPEDPGPGWTPVVVVLPDLVAQFATRVRAASSVQWPRVKASLRVSGASGWICLDNHGNPYNKAVPVVELAPGADFQRFLAIA